MTVPLKPQRTGQPYSVDPTGCSSVPSKCKAHMLARCASSEDFFGREAILCDELLPCSHARVSGCGYLPRPPRVLRSYSALASLPCAVYLKKTALSPAMPIPNNNPKRLYCGIQATLSITSCWGTLTEPSAFSSRNTSGGCPTQASHLSRWVAPSEMECLVSGKLTHAAITCTG